MKLGLCTGFDNLELAAKIGFDYIECAFSILATMPDEDYQRLLARKNAFPIPVSKANLFLPGDITPIGPAHPKGRSANIWTAHSPARTQSA